MKKWILPAAAAAAVVIAASVVVLNPGKNSSSSENTSANSSADASDSSATSVAAGEDFQLSAADLSSDEITFVRPVTDSKVELLARVGDDGKVKVALGTCQSCNGAPGAYYTQEGDVLKCNNCGLTFYLNVIDNPGGGCHSIMMDGAVYSDTDDGLVIHTSELAQYEDLFTKVADH